MVKKTTFIFTLFFLFFSMALILIACGKDDSQIKIGHSGGYLSAAVYAAQGNLAANSFKRPDIQHFRSSSDIAYALLSGTLDAGFVETDKLAAFAALNGFNRLTVVGKITYPFGATVVLRRGLNVRLHELSGLNVAVSASGCVLLEKFIADAKRLGADISDIKYQYMTFDAMIPALEARAVDAAIIKGSYSVVALQKGHPILYQNWEVEPGDECCPAIIEQAALVLLSHRNKRDAVKPFVDALLSTQKLSPDQLRRAVAENTVIPFEILQEQPTPEFSLANDELIKFFLEAAKHHQDNRHKDIDNE